MTQESRPYADVANSNWGPTPLYPHVNTVAPNDGSPVACPVPAGGSFDVQLQPLAAPSSPGPQTLTVRLDEASPGETLVTFFLLQVTSAGIQTVAGLSVQPTRALTSYDLVLSAGDIALITDYTNLRVRVIASGPGTGSGYGSGAGSRVSGGAATPCCPGGLPAILKVSPSNQTGTCGLGPWTLAWNGNVWEGSDTNGNNWALLCLPDGSDCTGLRLTSDSYGGADVNAAPNAGCSCSGPLLVFDVTLTGGPEPCSGTVRLTVTGVV